MKKFITMAILLISLFLFTGCNEPEYDKVVGIDVGASFYYTTFYQGDIIDLEDFDVLVTFESGITKEFTLEQVAQGGIDTGTVGTKSLKLKHLNKAVTIKYTVHAVAVHLITYKGVSLELYKGETANLENIEISVLFNNGTEDVVTLSKTNYSSIDYSVLGVSKDIIVSYQGKQTTIPYVVTCREIEESIHYDLVDNSTLYETGYTIVRNGNVLTLFNGMEESVEVLSMVEHDNNRFLIKNKRIGGVLYDIIVYRTGNTVVFEKVEKE